MLYFRKIYFSRRNKLFYVFCIQFDAWIFFHIDRYKNIFLQKKIEEEKMYFQKVLIKSVKI